MSFTLQMSLKLGKSVQEWVLGCWEYTLKNQSEVRNKLTTMSLALKISMELGKRCLEL